MAQTDEGICNLALDKLGATSLINTLIAPVTPNERLFVRIFPQYRDEELQKRVWLCATRIAKLTRTGDPLEGEEQPYGYQLPTDFIRAVRNDGDTWTRRGNMLWSDVDGGLRLEYVARITAGEMDPLLAGVIAARLAIEACEPVTQSNEKKKFADQWYADQVQEAGKVNAFQREAENISDSDEGYSWVTGRWF